MPKNIREKFSVFKENVAKKGHRLDPAHPNAIDNSPVSQPHINYCDYTKGGSNHIKLLILT